MIAPKTIVRDKVSGKTGVVCPPINTIHWGTQVVFVGSTTAVERNENDLVILDNENAVADPNHCGAGRGARCCIYLAFTPANQQWGCRRFSEDHWRRYAGSVLTTSVAQRVPIAFFPVCGITDASPAPTF